MAASDLTMILSEIKATKAELDALREEVAKERAVDRRRIAALEREEPQPLQKDRGETLRALLAVNVVKCWRRMPGNGFALANLGSLFF